MAPRSPSAAHDPDRASRRRELERVLGPFVYGTAEGMSSSQLTATRVAATARDAAAAILPLLGAPARSAHRVRRAIVPALTCSWSELDVVYAHTIDRLLALPPAVPGVEDPEWDAHLDQPRPAPREWNVHGSAWTASSREGDVVVGPSGTTGPLVRSDRRHALIVADGRPVRTRARCECPPASRRERGEVAFEYVTFGRRRMILDVRAGMACVLCRAPVV
jgi:hypothetical protein